MPNVDPPSGHTNYSWTMHNDGAPMNKMHTKALLFPTEAVAERFMSFLYSLDGFTSCKEKVCSSDPLCIVYFSIEAYKLEILSRVLFFS